MLDASCFKVHPHGTGAAGGNHDMGKLREYDEYLYKLRRLVENAFLHLKRWRSITMRYAKNTAPFAAVRKFAAPPFERILFLNYLSALSGYCRKLYEYWGE